MSQSSAIVRVKMKSFTIREAKEDDCEEILRLIKELAEYEKMPEQVSINADDLRRDAFGEKQFFHSFVAEPVNVEDGGASSASQLVGYVMYYYTYNPWCGRTCCMEDIYVAPEWRGSGIGTALWAEVTKIALSMECSFVQWVVLNWNKPTIDYYKRHGATDISKEEGWLLFRMNEPSMKEFVAKDKKQK